MNCRFPKGDPLVTEITKGSESVTAVEVVVVEIVVESEDIIDVVGEAAASVTDAVELGTA